MGWSVVEKESVTDPWSPSIADEGPGEGDMFYASMHVHAGVAVVTCRGRLDTAAWRACGFALAAAVQVESPWVILDLRQATVGPESVAVLSLVRRYASRHGARLALAALSPEGLHALQQAQVTALCRIMPTVPAAVAAAGVRMGPVHRMPAVGTTAAPVPDVGVRT